LVISQVLRFLRLKPYESALDLFNNPVGYFTSLALSQAKALRKCIFNRKEFMKHRFFARVSRTVLALPLTALFFSSCADRGGLVEEAFRVRGAPVLMRELPEEAGGFGSLSFLSKVDITAPQDGVLNRLYFREGDFIRQGALAMRLENPQIKLAVQRAENNFSQAQAACDLSRSRLLEGEFQAEAQLLAIEKAEAELAQARRRWEEDLRKHQHQEALFEAGGIHTEAILSARFSLDSGREQILIMERELDIRHVGCRDRDLAAAGLPIPSGEEERRRSLVSLMTASLRAELGAACARLEAAEKELASARVALEELNLRTPAAGVVGARYFEEGERVRTGDKILTLMDTASLYAIFPLREKDALRVVKGMKALVKIDGTGETREGTVDLVYPQADSQSLSFLVRVLLSSDSADGRTELKPGMFARVAVILGPPRQVLCVPESAVFNKKDGQGSVFVINGSVLSQRRIALGPALGDELEISAGLAAGELVVPRPDAGLREGSNVSLVR
jgi:RND family efflux transporter MFP subunit